MVQVMVYLILAVGVINILLFIIIKYSGKQPETPKEVIAPTETPEEVQEPPYTAFRRAFFALKRKADQLDEVQKEVLFNQRELKLDRQALKLLAAETKFDIEKKAEELKRLFAELSLVEKALSLSFQEKFLHLRTARLDFLEMTLQKTFQHQRSLLEIGENRLVLLHRELSQDLTGKKLLLQAQKNNQDAREREMKFYFDRREFKLYQDRRDLDLNTKEAKLFSLLDKIRNEHRAFDIEKRADELREEWEAIESSYQYHMEWLASRERWYIESLQEKGDTNADLYWFTYSVPQLDYKESKDEYGLTPSSYHYYPKPSPDDPLYEYYAENGKAAYVQMKLEQLKQSGYLENY